MLQQLSDLLPRLKDIKGYAEPFLGGGSMFFYIENQGHLINKPILLSDIKKIVMPMVGCSNGGLEWENVKKIIYQKLGNRNIEIIIARI